MFSLALIAKRMGSCEFCFFMTCIQEHLSILPSYVLKPLKPFSKESARYGNEWPCILNPFRANPNHFQGGVEAYDNKDKRVPLQ